MNLVEETERILATARADADLIVAEAREKAATHLKEVLSQVEAAEARLDELRAAGVELARQNIVAENALASSKATLTYARDRISATLESGFR